MPPLLWVIDLNLWPLTLKIFSNTHSHDAKKGFIVLINWNRTVDIYCKPKTYRPEIQWPKSLRRIRLLMFLGTRPTLLFRPWNCLGPWPEIFRRVTGRPPTCVLIFCRDLETWPYPILKIGLPADNRAVSGRWRCRQVAPLSQRDRATGWVSYGPEWKTGTGRQCNLGAKIFLHHSCS